ncbi:MAG: response regulator, partial [Actinomycetota bacterium]|nr:response regulator [Actinomycetota bacterium]
MARVLVVDDEPDIRRLVRMTLELAGHEITEASDGDEALEVLRADTHDAVVLDVAMPVLGGWEVLSRLKGGGGPLAAVPVIMLTARSGELDRIRGGIEGAVRYVTKPFEPDHLRDALRLALEEGPEPEQRRRAQRRALERLA